jgi:photosystem II stability/assembly factor-like uncharacterized protein
MSKKLLLLFLSFLILGFVSSFAQEDDEPEILALQNPNFTQTTPQSIFEDGQPIYNSPWEWLHPTPTGMYLRWVKMWDADNWYAVGRAGTFIKTTDAGATWFVNKWINEGGSTGSNYYLYDGHFFDMNTGIVVGGGGKIMRTTDAGVSWTIIDPLPTSISSLYDVHFLNDTLGYAAGSSTVDMYKTTDGGLTWTGPILIPTTFYRIYVVDENTVYGAGSSGNFHYSTDSGANWTTIDIGTTSTIYDMEFQDAMNGWVSGADDNPAYTTDGGLTWTETTASPTTSTQYDIDIMSTMSQTLNEGFEDATFPPAGWHTKNILGGVEWLRATGVAHSGNHSAVIAWQTTGGEDWLVTPQVSIVAGDTLTFWARRYFSGTYIPDSLLILASTTDTAVASFTTVLADYDVNTFAYPDFAEYKVDLGSLAGQNVYIAFRHFDVDGNGMYLDDVTIGEPMSVDKIFITGDSFDMFVTTDMGTTWTPIGILGAQPWTSTFYSTDFLSDNHFVNVGAYGMINETTPTDAVIVHGNWLRPGTLYEIWAESSDGNVIAVGAATSTSNYDQAIYSTDGGDTWAISVIEDSADLDFNDISMVTNLIGYTAGEDYRVMKTTDGGATWFRVTDPVTSTSDAECLYFVDENVGYVFGVLDDGYKTTDGGTTWSVLTTGATATFRGCYFTDANTGWVVGSSGTVIHTTDGGATFTPQTPNNTSTLYSIYMVNNNVGYISGSSGRVRKTTDGGVNWDTVDVGNTSPSLYRIDFRDELNGMTVGSSGRTFYTLDGGETWNFENTGMSTTYGLFVEKTSPDTSSAYVCGSLSYIMKNSVVIVPVELASFTASVSGNNVTLGWVTATELNNLGFEVERKAAEGKWVKVGFVDGIGTTTEPQIYNFTDEGLVSGIYNYRIKQIDYNGSYKYYNLDEAVEISAPESYALSQNYPNPFNPTTKIKYSVPADGFVNISVYNVLGEKVTDIVNSIQKAGSYEVTFDASSIASGMYLYRMESGNFISVKKMMILK